MALIKCPECGKEVSDKAIYCQNCGFLVNNYSNSDEMEQELNNNQLQILGSSAQKGEPLKQSGLGIAGMVLGIIGVIIFPLALLGIIGLSLSICGQKAKGYKKGCATAGVVLNIIAIFFFLIFIIAISPSTSGEKNQSDFLKENTCQSQEDSRTAKSSFNSEEIYNENDCAIYVSGGNNEKINFEIQNSSGKNYTFNIHAMSINGIMTKCNIYTGNVSVPSGKKGKMNIKFSPDWIKGIESIKYIDVLFWVYDNEDNMKEFDTGIIRLETNLFDGEIIPELDGEFASNGIRIIKKAIGSENISYVIINENEYLIQTSLKNCSLNGWAFEPGYSVETGSNYASISIDGCDIIVFPDSTANVDVNISDFLEENDIEKVEDFEFSLSIIPNEDYMQETETEKIIFKNK